MLEANQRCAHQGAIALVRLAQQFAATERAARAKCRRGRMCSGGKAWCSVHVARFLTTHPELPGQSREVLHTQLGTGPLAVITRSVLSLRVMRENARREEAREATVGQMRTVSSLIYLLHSGHSAGLPAYCCQGRWLPGT